MVGIVHAIGHSLGGICHIPHGQAMMILLPYCVRFNLERGHQAGLYGELLRALRPDLDKSSLTAEERDILFSARSSSSTNTCTTITMCPSPCHSLVSNAPSCPRSHARRVTMVPLFTTSTK